MTAFFNLLTGYSQLHEWQKLVVAPRICSARTIALIDEQTERAPQGKKSPNLRQAQFAGRSPHHRGPLPRLAGRRADRLMIRGICCLRPGLPGISENIRVLSIVDRFLEHSRILVFGEGAKQQVFLSSADLDAANFDRRVEVMVPIEAEDLRWRIVEEIIPAYMRDNRRAASSWPTATQCGTDSRDGESALRSQAELLQTTPVRKPQLPVESPPAASPVPVIEITAETNGAPDREKKKKKDKDKDKKGSPSPR